MVLVDPSLLVLFVIAIGCIVHGAKRSLLVLKMVTEENIPLGMFCVVIVILYIVVCLVVCLLFVYLFVL
jgi:hypothetical protein